MRYVKFLIGVFAILVALWVILGEQLSGASADAMVNARLVTLRSPIAGTLEIAPRELGSSLRRGEAVATTTDPLADVVRLNDLQMEVEIAQAVLAQADRDVADNEALIAGLAQRVETYRAHRVAELETRLAFARDRLWLLTGSADDGISLMMPPNGPAIADLPDETLDAPAATTAPDAVPAPAPQPGPVARADARPQDQASLALPPAPGERPLPPPAAEALPGVSDPDTEAGAERGNGLLDDDPTWLPGEPRSQALLISHARERVAVLEIELASAQAGAFLGDGYNDAPNAEQRRIELEGLLEQQRSAQKAAGERLTAVKARLDRERLGVNRFSSATISSPVDGTFWELRTANGETVQRGDAVAVLVDCGSAMVTASVTEQIYNSLQVGDSASFRPNGGTEVLSGTVNRLAGAGAETIYRNLAVAPSQKHLERYDVAIAVPALQGTGPGACTVGRTGRVFFDDRPLDIFRRLLRG